jgi:hypothetical protein
VNPCLWSRVNLANCALMISIAHSAASSCIHSSNPAPGRPGRIAN